MIWSNARVHGPLTHVLSPMTRTDSLPDALAASVWIRNCLVKLTLAASLISTERDPVSASGIDRPSIESTGWAFFVNPSD
jgi:hypothetical protein